MANCARHPLREYVTLEVGEFKNAYATMLHVMAGKLPVAQGFEPGSRTLPGLGTLEVEDTLFNRAMHTAADLFTDAAKHQSFRWRVVVVMPSRRTRNIGSSAAMTPARCTSRC